MLIDIKGIRYYRETAGRGYWEPTPRLKAVGFLPLKCGPAGPAAWAKAEAENQKWDEIRKSGKQNIPPPPVTLSTKDYPPGSVGEASSDTAVLRNG